MPITLYALKPGFQRMLRPLARSLVRAGVTANQVTVSAGLLSGVVALLLIFELPDRRLFLSLPVALFIRMALNALDGIIAREFRQQSRLGAYLNELTDVVSDALLYLPFALVGIFDSLWIGAVIVLSVISEMAGTVAVMTGASRRYDGPLGKSDRAFVFGALGFWIGAGLEIAPWAAYATPRCLALLLSLTIINRVKKGLEEHAHSTRPALQN